MANRTRDIIATMRRKYFEADEKNKIIGQYHHELEKATDHYDKEKEKSETQKTHERYRRKQQGTEEGMSLEDLIRPAKKVVARPGTYFHGPLKKLAEEFGDIKTMTYYMTVGQLTKYSEKGQQLINIRTGKLAYDEETQECFE